MQIIYAALRENVLAMPVETEMQHTRKGTNGELIILGSITYGTKMLQSNLRQLVCMRVYEYATYVT